MLDVMVHRQLHAAIDSSLSYGDELTDKEKMNDLCGSKSLRHRLFQILFLVIGSSQHANAYMFLTLNRPEPS